jgi:hypothetical protein
VIDDEFWGPEPTPEELHRLEVRNTARGAIIDAVTELLGTGLSPQAKEAWIASRQPFLGGRRPYDVMFDGLNEVFEAIEQYNNGDFA